MVCIFKPSLLVFKQYFTYFNALFHSHVFSQIFSNNNFQFLNICTKRTLGSLFSQIWGDYILMDLERKLLNPTKITLIFPLQPNNHFYHFFFPLFFTLFFILPLFTPNQIYHKKFIQNYLIYYTIPFYNSPNISTFIFL